ncbi:MAG: NHLP family bacteriocin export ABC transporter peptidase/permease/ATPase subunit [bacterium]|nr:NHLP family bacteriocin export ABC transporter peptidase/permease/ATPase subunit [bacterium]
MNPALDIDRDSSVIPRKPGPSGRRRLRTPIFPQYEATECGAACLGSVLAHFGRWVSQEELRESCAVNRDGSTAADIFKAAKQYGLEVDAWTKEPAQLKDLALPSVLFWEFNHFVVLEGFGNGVYHLNDPAFGRRTLDEQEFGEAFTGVAMVMQPGPGFKPGGERPGVMRKVRPWLRGVKGPLGFVASCGLLLALPGLLLPVLLTLFVNEVLFGQEDSWAGPVALAAGLAAALSFVLTWFQQKNLRRLAIRLSATQGEQMLSRLFRLPAQFFTHRYAGDLTTRMQLVETTASQVSTQFTGLMIELVMSGAFLALMIVYNPVLAAVVFGLGLANVALTRVVSRARNDENQQVQRELALLAGVSSCGLRNIEALRSTASEDDFFARWSGHQARELTARQKFAELGYIAAALPSLAMLLNAAVVFGVGGMMVMSEDMTIGALMGFYVLAASFLQPVGRFAKFADAFQVMESNLQRIQDVTTAPEDPVFAVPRRSEPDRAATLNGKLRLDGRMEIRNVTFGYRLNHSPLIEEFNLSVAAGQRVAVIGPTGSGKSTLLKLVAGGYTPWSGEVLFDGTPIGDVPREVLTSSVAVVDQHIYLFSGTVRDNLTMWNPAVSDHRVVAAAKDALIHDEVMSRPGGYSAFVDEGGMNFSHGQRQRMEIARALAANPSVMLLDEATSRLDSVTEMGIDDSLRRRGCTCLIVAHRLSTIRDCDQIVVLDRGQAVQRGTHEELLADRQGMYYRLVQAE